MASSPWYKASFWFFNSLTPPEKRRKLDKAAAAKPAVFQKDAEHDWAFNMAAQHPAAAVGPSNVRSAAGGLPLVSLNSEPQHNSQHVTALAQPAPQQPTLPLQPAAVTGNLHSRFQLLMKEMGPVRASQSPAVQVLPAVQHTAASHQPEPVASQPPLQPAPTASQPPAQQPSAVKPRQLLSQFDPGLGRGSGTTPAAVRSYLPSQLGIRYTHRIQAVNLTALEQYRQKVLSEAMLPTAGATFASAGAWGGGSQAGSQVLVDQVDLTKDEELETINKGLQAQYQRSDACKELMAQKIRSLLDRTAVSSLARASESGAVLQAEHDARKQAALALQVQQRDRKVAEVKEQAASRQAAQLSQAREQQLAKELLAQMAVAERSQELPARVRQRAGPKAKAPSPPEECVIISSDEEAEVLQTEDGEGEEGEEEPSSTADSQLSLELEHELDQEEDDSGVPANTESELALWERIMREPGDLYATLVTHARSGIPLTKDKLRCLNDGTWLNDEVINVSMALLQERDSSWRQAAGKAANGRPQKGLKAAPHRPRCHFFSTFFLNKLFKDAGRYSYKDVRRWTTPKKLESTGQGCSCVLDCDLLLFPVHCGTSHWAAACVDLQHKCLYFWDSLGSPDMGLLGHLAHWVADEAADKLKERGPEAVAAFADAASQWERISPRNQVPQQNNCCDCGVFCIKFIECASAGREFDFHQGQISRVRRSLLSYIVHSTWPT